MASGVLLVCLREAMLLRPPEQLIEYRPECLGGCRDLVFDAWRNFWINCALDQPVGFEIAQLCGQHVLSDTRDGSTKFTEALLALDELPKDFALPFSGQPPPKLDGTGLPLL
jgi:hypothetical protein